MREGWREGNCPNGTKNEKKKERGKANCLMCIHIRLNVMFVPILHIVLT